MMRHKTGYDRETGVSEVVGFIIIIGIIMTGIALVTLYGYPALLDAQQNANIRNMERNMISIQSDVNSLTYKLVPYKETSIQVSGGVLLVERPDPEIYIQIGTPSMQLLDYLDPVNSSFSPGSIKYKSESGDISIALENGAVVKRQSGGSVMLSEPRWFIDNSGGVTTLVITLIQIELDDPAKALAKSGIGTVQMSIVPLMINKGNDPINTDDDTNIIDIQFNDPEEIRITYGMKSEYYSAFTRNYFEYTLGMTKIGGVTWKRDDIDRIIIKAWRVNVINL